MIAVLSEARGDLRRESPEARAKRRSLLLLEMLAEDALPRELPVRQVESLDLPQGRCSYTSDAQDVVEQMRRAESAYRRGWRSR